MEFLIITGMSGAGKTETINTLEEMGYYCMDNLPPALLIKFADLFLQTSKETAKVAVVVDIRGGEFFDSLFKSLEDLAEEGIDHKILFLEASNKELVRRYKESRRTHPLRPSGSIVSAIDEERERLSFIKNKAHYIIDTSNLSVKNLKDELRTIFIDGEDSRKLSILISSFGFKNGILLDGDLIYDVRFLPNPFYIPELKELSGENKETKDYVFKWTQTNVFMSKLVDMIEFLIPYYIEEGKTQLSIGIGCTGGFHRSVAISNELAKILKEKGNRVVVNHRDINRQEYRYDKKEKLER